MKYVVICYAEHDHRIEMHETFDNKNDARTFLQKDMSEVYDNESQISDDICVNPLPDGTYVHMSSCNGKYRWTWELIEVE